MDMDKHYLAFVNKKSLPPFFKVTKNDEGKYVVFVQKGKTTIGNDLFDELNFSRNDMIADNDNDVWFFKIYNNEEDAHVPILYILNHCFVV